VRPVQLYQPKFKLSPPLALTVASNASRLVQPINALSPSNTILSGAGPTATTFVS